MKQVDNQEPAAIEVSLKRSISKTSTSGGSPYQNTGGSITPEGPQSSSSGQQKELAVGNQDSGPPSTGKTKTRNSPESAADIDAKVREITGLHVDDELATTKGSKWNQQPLGLVTMGPEPILPRRCLFRKNLVARRNRANKRSGPLLPRKKAPRRGKSESGVSIMKAIRSVRFNRKKLVLK